jgi:hypothetical protein
MTNKIYNDKKDLERIFELITDSATRHIFKEIDAMLCDHPDYHKMIGIKSVSYLSKELIGNINIEIQKYWDKAKVL